MSNTFPTMLSNDHVIWKAPFHCKASEYISPTNAFSYFCALKFFVIQTTECHEFRLTKRDYYFWAFIVNIIFEEAGVCGKIDSKTNHHKQI